MHPDLPLPPEVDIGWLLGVTLSVMLTCLLMTLLLFGVLARADRRLRESERRRSKLERERRDSDGDRA